MNREIKFRVWYKPKGEMEYLREFAPSQAEGAHIVFGCEEYGHRFYNCLDDNDWEVMQYAGFKDGKGKEVYEGDIVDCTRNGEVFGAREAIEFLNGRFAFRHRGLAVYDWQALEEDNDLSFEVIGNIFENPELLP